MLEGESALAHPHPHTQAHPHTNAHARAPAPANAHASAPAPAPAVLCGGLYQCHLQNDNPAQAESFHGCPGEVKPPTYIKTG
ncbi:hypothetical protein O181_042239 [Austropuccinia psidii MF-1]|uniref:Uncharacterized protein n=1 Tax=Austropuccinia psidii MF-1 TaxID=1389203 RepID=A0A9Q3HHA1_9BASI|nr:hypothetical protein [Austropuccinia psidii MF-1]